MECPPLPDTQTPTDGANSYSALHAAYSHVHLHAYSPADQLGDLGRRRRCLAGGLRRADKVEHTPRLDLRMPRSAARASSPSAMRA